ncbi:response regulator transcription factor [Mastigocladopsis repens]|uniref:response regulator transcription factor n=1 Tax=Mastigocladopsis repens TaxID=221287 RepID=UPI0002D872CC|nr:LuxR C-terminal-related transcriptional regulator [Mastigocladopsis repens]
MNIARQFENQQRFHQNADLEGSPELSEREREVLQLMATGKSNQELASTFDITESTVHFYVKKKLGKLEVKDRMLAGLTDLRRGIASLSFLTNLLSNLGKIFYKPLILLIFFTLAPVRSFVYTKQESSGSDKY